MFSQEPRRFLKKKQLMEVICQFRFPEILAIAAKPPVDFQEAIRDEFPQYSARKEIPAPKIAGTPGNFSLQNQPETINYQFAAADGSWRVNLTSKFISLASSRYTSWEDFAKKLDRPLAAFIQIYKPAYMSGWVSGTSTPSPGRIWTWRAFPSGSCSSPVIWASWGRRM